MYRFTRIAFCLLFMIMTCTVMAQEPPLRCALVNPELGTPEMVKHSFRALFSYLSKRVNREIIVSIIPTVEETVEALKKNEVDFGYTGIIDFFQIQQGFNILPAATFTRGNKSQYTACLVVRVNEAGLSIKDYKGKRFGFTSFHKQYGGLYPEIILKENGLPTRLEDYFASVHPYYADVPVIYDLIKSKIDLCAVSEMTLETLKENSPALLKNISLIDRYPDLMFAPIFYRADMKPDLRDKLINELIAFIATSEGQQMMMMFKLDGVKTVSNEDYKQNRALAHRLNYITKP
ncbi:PhnD/SsuA/transferrin family substrate-binding protein [bacterium]|nr:PhnD/SsuA/transferrin family substrate-binding protein [bacterium]